MSIYSTNDNSKSLNAFSQISLAATHLSPNSDISKAIELISSGNYQAAYDHLKSRTADPDVNNIKAILLMRLGKPGQAVNLLRSAVIDPTTLLIRTGVPDHIKLNFAEALFMSGEISGCLDILRTVDDKSNEQLNQIQDNIRSWEKTLTFLKWIDWKVCGIVHIKNELTTDHLPGKFDWERETRTNVQKTGNSSLDPATTSHELAV